MPRSGARRSAAGAAITPPDGAVDNNRARLLSGIAKAALERRAEFCERRFALVLDRGGMRRTWLRGRTNVRKCYLLHVAGYNLGLIMRLSTGHGTPCEAAAARNTALAIILPTDDVLILVIIALVDDDAAGAVLIVLVSACG